MVAANYAKHRSTASRLLSNANIAARVEELKAEAAEKAMAKVVVDKVWVIQGIVKNIERAIGAGQFGVAMRGYELCGKEQGMFVDRHRHDHRRIDDMNDEELVEFLGGEPEPAEIEHALASSTPAGNA